MTTPDHTGTVKAFLAAQYAGGFDKAAFEDPADLGPRRTIHPASAMTVRQHDQPIIEY